MYVGCAQKVIVGPPMILNAVRLQKQFLTFQSSSLKSSIGGTLYYAIISSPVVCLCHGFMSVVDRAP